MEGKFIIEAKEEEPGTTSLTAMCELSHVSPIDKVVAARTIIEALEFDRIEKVMLTMGIKTGIWPDRMGGDDSKHIKMDLKTIKDALDRKLGEGWGEEE